MGKVVSHSQILNFKFKNRKRTWDCSTNICFVEMNEIFRCHWILWTKSFIFCEVVTLLTGYINSCFYWSICHHFCTADAILLKFEFFPTSSSPNRQPINYSQYRHLYTWSDLFLIENRWLCNSRTNIIYWSFDIQW